MHNTEQNYTNFFEGKWLQTIYFSYIYINKDVENYSTKLVYLNVAKINWLQPLTLKNWVN